MSSLGLISTIAGFEFRRVFKPKDLVITLVMFCLGALFFAWLRSMDEPGTKVAITVIGDAFEVENADHLRFNFFPLPTGSLTDEEIRRQVEVGDMGTVVLIRALDDVEIIVQDKAPVWYPELIAKVNEARVAARVKESGLSGDELDSIFASPPVDLSSATEVDFDAQDKLKLLAALCLGCMILGLFVGSAHLFTGITGEKQNHITESVLSAVPVQTWIDGKCVGLCFVALFGIVSVGLCWMIGNQIFGIFHEPVSFPFEIVDFTLFGSFVLLALLGFLMWFTFFAAIASTIDDPNTSSRSIFILVPAIATGIAFIGIDEPDAGMYRLRSIFPLTSPGSMVVRLVNGNVAFWEFALAVALLVGAIWLFRSVAGKIFGMAMLMRGKELAWREIWRAFTRA